MNLQRIAILAVQESRMTNEDIRNLENKHPGLKFLNNGNHSNKQGILFTINERLLEIEKGELERNHKILIPNTVSQLKIKWGEDQNLNLVNIYAPNYIKEKETFYKKLAKEQKKEPQENLCIMGDTNCVLDNITRSSAHANNKQVTNQLRKIIRKYKLLDTWRIQNPKKKKYTFDQKGLGAAARIEKSMGQGWGLG